MAPGGGRNRPASGACVCDSPPVRPARIVSAMTDRSVSRHALLADLARTFRHHGYEGASLTRLAKASGLQKASLYHHFPGGKQAMAEAVLDEVAERFEAQLFSILRGPGPLDKRLKRMAEVLAAYHDGGTEPSLFAMLAQGPSRARFAARIESFYGRWIASLGAALTDSGLGADEAVRRAADAVMTIEGAVVLSRALGDSGPFRRAVRQLAESCEAPAQAAQ
jgi:TetR/AcrR family transcriptional repressor of lmrAB and yxaGH operons